MPEHMRSNVAFVPNGRNVAVYHCPYWLLRQTMFQLINKEKSRAGNIVLKNGKIVAERFQNIGVFNLDYSFFWAFAENFQCMVFQVYCVGGKGAYFGYPSSGSKKSFKHGNIAECAVSGIFSPAELQRAVRRS